MIPLDFDNNSARVHSGMSTSSASTMTNHHAQSSSSSSSSKSPKTQPQHHQSRATNRPSPPAPTSTITVQHQQQQQQPHPPHASSSATVVSNSSHSYSRSGRSHSGHSGTTTTGSSNNSGKGSSKSNNKNNKIVVSSYSNLATQSIGEGKYRQAFEYYQLALHDYLQGGGGGRGATSHNIANTNKNAKHNRIINPHVTVVELVNAAATCFNLGALAKKLTEHETAAEYFGRAQDMYFRSASLVEEYHHRRRSSSGGTNVKNNGRAVVAAAASSASQSSVSTLQYSCQVCLLQLLVETLQAKAHLHYKYQSRVDQAIDCHEQVIELLDPDGDDDNDDNDDDYDPLDENTTGEKKNENRRRRRPRQYDTVYFRIHFILLPEEGRWRLLATSLQALGKFYVEKGQLDDAIMAYQETLSVLKNLHEASLESTEERQEEILQILGALSDIYIQHMNRPRHQSSHHHDVAQLERLALVQEDLENWDKAIQCWERVLHCLSREHGEASLEVAGALTQLARVMILEGNLEGALDLYHASANIYLKEPNVVARGSSTLPGELFAQTLQLYGDLEQDAEAIPWLKMLLSKSDGNREEEAKIYCELGRLYLKLGYLQAASDALYHSSDLFGGESSYDVVDLIERVESLMQQSSPPLGRDESDSESFPLTAIAEDGESALVPTEDGESRLTGVSDDVFDIDATKSLSAILGKEDSTDADDAAMDLLVEKAMSMEGERLDALVSGTSHAMITGGSQLENFARPAEVSDLSSSLTSPESSPAKIVFMAPDDCQSGISHPTDEGRNALLDPPSGNQVFDDENDHGLPDPELLPPSPAITAHSKSTEETEPSLESAGSSPGEPSRRHIDPTPSQRVAINERFSGYPSPLDTIPKPIGERSEVKDVHENDVRGRNIDDDDNDDGYESFPGTAHSLSETEESPTVPNRSRLEIGVQVDTPSPLKTPTSRTGLLKPVEKLKSNGQQKSLLMPGLGSPKQSKYRGRNGYSEVLDKPVGETQRSRLVKALSSPFRRSKSRSKIMTENGLLDTLDEENEVRGPMPLAIAKLPVEEEPFQEAPVAVINAPSDDDAISVVSQITFRMEDTTPPKHAKGGQWWWGVSAEGLEGWFQHPSNYVHQAVEAAEGFLSAKAIHDRVKSRPLDFDSDEESEAADEEDFSLLKDSTASKQSKTQLSSEASKNVAGKPKEMAAQSRTSLELSKSKPSFGSASGNAVSMPRSSVSSGHQSLDSQIQEKEASLEAARAEMGPKDVAVANLLFDLAKLFDKKKDGAASLDYCEQALEIQKVASNLSDACQTLSFMADTHLNSNSYKDALSCYAEVQRMQEATYGHYHEEVASTMNRIGNVLARQGEFDLAMENHNKALRILKECCGEKIKHPLVSHTLIQIGSVYYKERNSLATIQSKTDGYTTFIECGMLEIIGRAHEDRGSYRMAIAFFEEKLQFLDDTENSDDLEDVAETLNSLGMLSCRAGLYLEAIDYYDRALGIQMKLGCDDVQLAMARVLAGSVQHYLGHFSKALKLFQDALDTLLKQVGQKHETVAATLFHMGLARAAQCNYDDAMSNLRDALEVQMKLLGNDHPATLRTRREIGNLFAVYESELVAAFDEFDDILQCQKAIHGEKHPNVAETLHSIGCAHARNGDVQAALKILEECYNMRLEFLGMDHPQQATTLHEIAKIQLKRGRTKKAIHIIDAALNIRVESLSEHHIDVALAQAMKASCLVARGNFVEANKLFAEALPTAQAAVGANHPSVAWIHVQIGVMNLRKCQFEEASESIQNALKIYLASDMDEDHPGIQEAKEELERVERAEMLCV